MQVQNSLYVSGMPVQTVRKPDLKVDSAVTSPAKKPVIYSIAFTGKDRNPKQIALLTVEVNPLAKTGGMGDVNGELPVEMAKAGFDMRTFSPFYNAPGKIPKNAEGKPVYKTHNGTEYLVENTGVSTKFRYGAKESTVTLYKVVDSKVQFPAYLLHSPDTFSKDKREYTGPYLSNMCPNYLAFSKAAVEINKILPKNEEENFNPKFIQCADWHVASSIKEIAKDDKAFDDAVSIFTIHNIGQAYQGRMAPLVAAVNDFEPAEIPKLSTDKSIRKEVREIRDQVKNDELSALVNSHSYKKALVHIADNYEIYAEKATDNIDTINKQIISLFPNKPWLDGSYNISKTAIEKSDKLTTVSEGFLTDMQTNPAIAPGLTDLIVANAHKSVGIVNGLDPNSFDPTEQSKDRGEDIKQLYSIDNFVEGKAANKAAVQENLQKDKPNKFGTLEKNPDAPLAVFISRYDPYQKGVDILMRTAKDYLKENPDAQLVIAGKGYVESNSPFVKEFIQEVVEKYPGRAVLDSNFANMHQYLAAADMFVMPSRYEPCGLTQLQAMRMGTIPVVAKTGGLDDTVSNIGSKATGFKTKDSIINPKDHPEAQLLKAMNKAYETFKTDKETWNNMTRNAMEYDSSWKKSISRYVNEVYTVPEKPIQAQKISNFA